ncbi:hypothetical protein HPB50_003676 [Hyalomma asiaticum]|uniref:Uncharacterized protein n=1 Tax=Hyalomma asiaticum TaxID=266040 RepID=A0ACB7SSK7_HYAAI|nr:hypothetical protein HPB50_003676 [Hyalomma asiaticum]
MNPAGSSDLRTGDEVHQNVRPSGASLAAFQHVNLACAWLLHVEAHFRLRQITSEQTKFFHLVSILPQEVAKELADVTTSPYATNPFDTLSAPGDSRPSQFLRHIRQLFGGVLAFQKDKLLRELFLQRFPRNMVPGLVASGEMPLDNLAEVADRIADYSRVSSLSDATAQPPPTATVQLASLEGRLNGLTRRLDELAPFPSRSSRGSGPAVASRKLRALQSFNRSTREEPAHPVHPLNLPSQPPFFCASASRNVHRGSSGFRSTRGSDVALPASRYNLLRAQRRRRRSLDRAGQRVL